MHAFPIHVQFHSTFFHVLDWHSTFFSHFRLAHFYIFALHVARINILKDS